MNWRDPSETLPIDNQRVFIMLAPHKERAESIEIVGGWVSHGSDGSCIVDNFDELGMGGIHWYLRSSENQDGYVQMAVAWIPLEEIPFPSWVDKVL